MLRLLLFISVLLFSFMLHQEGNTASIYTYTPGATIAMTGSNSSVRFDVASDLDNNHATATIPLLTTATQQFTGVFYATGIGWIEFSTGTYRVGLDCDAQDLSDLTAECKLTGTGWSENVGDIYFSSGTTVIYDPTSGILSGSILSFVGDIDLSGISLPLRPVTINESLIGFANHNATLSVSGAWQYEGGIKPWEITITPISSIVAAPITGVHGVFTSDLSLASIYDIMITDSNESTTQFTLTVNPGIPTTTLVPGSHYTETYCIDNGNSDPTRCPDGVTRIASKLESLAVGAVIANGIDTYTHTIKVRDGYGNRVKDGSIKIKYITKVKNVQVDIGEHYIYMPSNDGDGVVGDFANIFGENIRTYLSLLSDITYTIASTAPTNTTDNRIILDSIKYSSGGTDYDLIGNGSALIFTPLYTATTNSLNPPIVGVPNAFSTIVAKNDSTTFITPTIISTMKIGTGYQAEWKSLSSDPVKICKRYPLDPATDNFCDWSDPDISIIATSSSSIFTFTGTYTKTSNFDEPESAILKNYIFYNDGTHDILYPSETTTISGTTLSLQRIRIFGQTSTAMRAGSQNRVAIINLLKEKVALLGRNRADYTDADYAIYIGNQTVTNTSFDNKRTIITIGGDITIGDNIVPHDRPLAIIALSNTNNVGGNIIISGSVSDINSILIAEHGIISNESNYQLYIHGSMVSANPPQEEPITTCPYFASLLCTPSYFDLPFSRRGFSIPSTDGGAYPNSVIIKLDTRFMSDPPPAIRK